MMDSSRLPLAIGSIALMPPSTRPCGDQSLTCKQNRFTGITTNLRITRTLTKHRDAGMSDVQLLALFLCTRQPINVCILVSQVAHAKAVRFLIALLLQLFCLLSGQLLGIKTAHLPGDGELFFWKSYAGMTMMRSRAGKATSQKDELLPNGFLPLQGSFASGKSYAGMMMRSSAGKSTCFSLKNTTCCGTAFCPCTTIFQASLNLLGVDSRIW